MKEINRIALKEELKLIKCLNKLFSESQNPITEYSGDQKLKDIGFMEPANVSMIVLKSAQIKDIFKRFIDKDYNFNCKIPELKYTGFQIVPGTDLKCKYSLEYLTLIMNCFNCINESVNISINKEFPMTLEGDHFNFILAPRVDND